MPNFQILYKDIKDFEQKDDKKKEKIKTKEVCDFGLPPQKEGEEKQAKAGTTFDPKNFKGNAQLFIHLNEVALSMLKVKYQASESIKKKKKKKVIYGDDYNTILPDDVLAERRNTYDDDSNNEEEEKEPTYGTDMLDKINNLAEILKNRKSSKILKESVMKTEEDEGKV